MDVLLRHRSPTLPLALTTNWILRKQYQGHEGYRLMLDAKDYVVRSLEDLEREMDKVKDGVDFAMLHERVFCGVAYRNALVSFLGEMYLIVNPEIGPNEDPQATLNEATSQLFPQFLGDMNVHAFHHLANMINAEAEVIGRGVIFHDNLDLEHPIIDIFRENFDVLRDMTSFVLERLQGRSRSMFYVKAACTCALVCGTALLVGGKVASFRYNFKSKMEAMSIQNEEDKKGLQLTEAVAFRIPSMYNQEATSNISLVDVERMVQDRIVKKVKKPIRNAALRGLFTDYGMMLQVWMVHGKRPLVVAKELLRNALLVRDVAVSLFGAWPLISAGYLVKETLCRIGKCHSQRKLARLCKAALEVKRRLILLMMPMPQANAAAIRRREYGNLMYEFEILHKAVASDEIIALGRLGALDWIDEGAYALASALTSDVPKSLAVV